MRTCDSDTLAALGKRALVARDFIWLTGISFADGTTQSIGFWSDFGTITAPVVDGQTGENVDRDFIGTGTLLAIDDVPLTSDLTVRTINATLSQINEGTALAVRGYNVKNGPAQIYRGLFDPANRNLVAPALPRFVGFVSKCVITTPSENQDGSIVLTLASHTQELTRSSADTSSDQSQQLRSAGDGFFKYAAVMGSRQLFWGENQGTAPADTTSTSKTKKKKKNVPLRDIGG